MTALVADRIFDGTRMRRHVAVLISGDKIKRVVPLSAIPNDALVTDFGAATILPGLIDLHVHVSLQNTAAIAPTGVLTVRDLGHYDVINPTSSQSAVRYFSAGPLLSAPHGAAVSFYKDLTRVIRSPAQARRVAQHLIAKGADVIKVYLASFGRNSFPLLTRRELLAIGDVAHASNLHVVAHVDDARGLRRAIGGKVDEIAHIPCLHVPTSLLRRVVDNDIPIVGTLHVREVTECAPAPGNASRFLRIDGTLLYGSDIGNRGIPLGLDVRELELMQAAGLSSVGVLRAATSLAADELPLSHPVGVIATGSQADLLVVEGNPGRDLALLKNVLYVMRGGESIFPVQGTPTPSVSV